MQWMYQLTEPRASLSLESMRKSASLRPLSPTLTCVALFALAMILFLINIQFPRNHDFDEFHYVPSAKQFLDLKVNQNWEHPPLGKELMAVSIGIWGDRPIGWRFASVLFSSLTLVGMYLWALAVF